MTDKLNDQNLESLSALCDGEAGELELRRILKNIEHDDDMRASWRRYQIIGSAMRREAHIHSIDVSEAVFQAISEDSTHDNPAPSLSAASQADNPAKRHWKHYFGKSVAAAGVAAVMVVGVNQMDSDSPISQESGTLAEAAEPVEALTPVALNSEVNAATLGFDLPIPEARTISNQSMPANAHPQYGNVQVSYQSSDITDVATQELLNRLLIQHAHRASANGSMGLMPFARVSKMEEPAAE